MRKISDFSTQLSAFLTDYLPKQRNVSGNTIASYCDAFRLFLRFCSQRHGITPDKMKLKDITAILVKDYLRWLENERGCGATTRNQRLAAIHSFVKYVNTEVPENLAEFMKILKIPQKKSAERVVDYLSVKDMKLVLRQPDVHTPSGRQHLVMLSLLYDSACRAQELVDLTVRDARNIQKKIIVKGKWNPLLV